MKTRTWGGALAVSISALLAWGGVAEGAQNVAQGARATSSALLSCSLGCRAIELVGKYVIPAFKSPRSALWDSEYEHLGITGVPRNLI